MQAIISVQKSVLLILILSLLLTTPLLAQGAQQENPKLESPAENKPLELTLQEVTLVNKEGFFVIPEDNQKEYLTLSIIGSALIEIHLHNNANQIVIAHQVNLSEQTTQYLIPIDLKVIQKIQGGRLSVKVMEKRILVKGIYVEVNLTSSLSLTFNDMNNFQVVSKFFDYFKISLRVNEDFTADNDYVIFIELRGFIDDFKLNQKMNFLLNQKSKDFPTENRFEMKGEVDSFLSVQKLITNKDEFFCIKKECVFNMLVEAIEVDEFFVQAIISPQRIEFPLVDFMQLVMFVTDEHQTFIVDLPEFKDNQGFSMEVLNNKKLEIYIDIDQEHTELNQWRFSNKDNPKFNLLFNAEEIKQLGFSGKRLYLHFEFTEGRTEGIVIGTFNVIESPYFIQLVPDNDVQSQLIGGGIENFFMFYNPTTQKKTYYEQIILSSIESNSVLFVKECLPGGTFEECKIQAEDVQNKDFGKNPNRIEMKTNQLSAGKEEPLKLAFNCLDGRASDKQFPNSYPISNTCFFMVGVYNPMSSGLNFFEIERKNYNYLLIDLEQKKNYILFGLEKEHILLKSLLPYTMVNQMPILQIKMVLIRGKGNLKIWQNIPKEELDQERYSYFLDFQDEDNNLISSQFFKKNIQLFWQPDQDLELNISASFEDFTQLELFFDFKKVPDEDFSDEVILNQIAEGSIIEDNLYEKEKIQYFYKTFVYRIFELSSNDDDELEISIDTHVYGLLMCVQYDSDTFQKDKDCDVSTDTNKLYLTLNSENRHLRMAINVSYKNTNPDFLNQLPINFKILVSNKDLEINNLIPGNQYDISISPDKTKIFKVSLIQMKQRGAFIMNTTFSDVEIGVYPEKTPNTRVATLNRENFALYFGNIQEFQQIYCNLPQCNIIFKLSNKSKFDAEVTLAYVYDSMVLRFKIGQTLFIPSSLPLGLMIEPEKQNAVYLNYKSHFAEVNMKSKIIELKFTNNGPLTGDILDFSFDYKQENQNEGTLTFSPKDFDTFQKPGVFFVFYPTKVNEKLATSSLQVLDDSSIIKLTIHTDAIKINPYTLFKSTIAKEDFAYFFFNNDYNQDFSIMLSVPSGQALIFLNKGMKNFPTVEKYWKKNDDLKGGELVVHPENPEEQSTAYTIGIYAKEASEISLLYAPNFDDIIDVNYQELVNFNLGQSQYFFKMKNPNQKMKLLLSAQQARVNVNLIKYNDNTNKSMVEILIDPSSVIKSVILEPSNLVKELEIDDQNFQGNYVLQVQSLDGTGQLIFAFYNPSSPLKVYSNNSFVFGQNKDTEITFEVDLKNFYERVSVQSYCLLGSVKMEIGEQYQKYQDPIELSLENPQNITTLDKKTEMQIDITSKVYIKVTAREQTQYQILVKSNKQFQELKASLENIMIVEKEIVSYAFYFLSREMKKKLKELSFIIYMPFEFDNDPELLFFASADVTLDKDNIFVPMPIIENLNKQIWVFRKLTIKTQIVDGYYFFKFKGFKRDSEILIYVDEGDQKISYINDVDEGIISNKEIVQKIYINEPGTLQINYQSCQELSQAQLETSHSDKPSSKLTAKKEKSVQSLNIQAELDQNFGIFEIDETVVSYDLKKPGQLTVKSLFEQDQQNQEQGSYYQRIMFKSKNRLFPEEYVDQTINQTPYAYIEGDEVVINFYLPSFIKQTYSDFKDYTLSIWVTFYLLHHDENFLTKFKACGKSLIQRNKTFKKNFDFSLSDFEQENSKQNQEFRLSQANLKDAGQNLIIAAYFNFSLLKSKDQLNMFTNSSIRGEVPMFLITNKFHISSKMHMILLFGVLICLVLAIGFAFLVKKKRQREVFLRSSFNSENISKNNAESEMISIEKTQLDKSQDTTFKSEALDEEKNGI